MKPGFNWRLPLLLSAVLLPGAARAQLFTIDTSDRGWIGYSATTGQARHNADCLNFLTGWNSVYTYRSFFVFDLPTFDGTITSATLRLFNPDNGFLSSDLSESLAIYDVSTPVGTLTTSGTTKFSEFDDLGTGTLFGTATITSAQNGSFIDITLNAAALAALQAEKGNVFAFGAALESLGFVDLFEYAFGNSGLSDPADGSSQLLISVTPNTPVVSTPEPATYGLMAATALVGLAVWRRRRASGARG